MKQTYQTSQPLEYIALLSGLSMAGTDVSDTDIKNTRLTHTKDKTKPMTREGRETYMRPYDHAQNQSIDF